MRPLILTARALSNASLDRDVLFLGTADEEADFAGALRAISPEGWRDRLKDAEFLMTEGGENLADALGRPSYFGVETAEKGPFWLKLRTAGTPGHGSRPISDSAPNRLVRALERVRLHKTEMISNTILRAGYKTNVIPGTAEAELDVRLLPGGDPQATVRRSTGVFYEVVREVVARRPAAATSAR